MIPIGDMEPLTKLLVMGGFLLLASLPIVGVGIGVVIVMRSIWPPKRKDRR